MVLSDKHTGQVLGGGIVGRSAGDLISVLALAIEMRCDIEDIELTIFLIQPWKPSAKLQRCCLEPQQI